jgi:hypothetical protein
MLIFCFQPNTIVSGVSTGMELCGGQTGSWPPPAFGEKNRAFSHSLTHSLSHTWTCSRLKLCPTTPIPTPLAFLRPPAPTRTLVVTTPLPGARSPDAEAPLGAWRRLHATALQLTTGAPVDPATSFGKSGPSNLWLQAPSLRLHSTYEFSYLPFVEVHEATH